MSRMIYESQYGAVYDDRKKNITERKTSEEFSVDNRENASTKTERKLKSHWERFGTGTKQRNMKITIRENEKAYIDNARKYIFGKEKMEKQVNHCEGGQVGAAIDTIKRALDMMDIFSDAPGTVFTNEGTKTMQTGQEKGHYKVNS